MSGSPTKLLARGGISRPCSTARFVTSLLRWDTGRTCHLRPWRSQAPRTAITSPHTEVPTSFRPLGFTTSGELGGRPSVWELELALQGVLEMREAMSGRDPEAPVGPSGADDPRV